MRAIDRDIVVLTRAKQENIYMTNQNKIEKKIEIGVQYLKEDGSFIHSETYLVEGENYTLLMSTDSCFAPGKPENEYREIDLWCIIDKIRNT